MQNAKYLATKINWGSLAHSGLNIGLPIVVLLLVAFDLPIIAIVVIIASKWQVFAVQPRHWFANIRANMPDLMVGLSFLVLMVRSNSLEVNLLWTALYVLWLLVLKPQTSGPLVGIQAMVVQFLSLTALFWYADRMSETLLVVAAWLIGLMSARHFLGHFEEPLIRVISFTWALVVAEFAWLLNHWLVAYELVDRGIIIPQISIVVSTVAYGLGSIYYLYKTGKLRKGYIRPYVISSCAILLLVIIFSDWSATR